jgi:hypothetical protein
MISFLPLTACSHFVRPQLARVECLKPEKPNLQKLNGIDLSTTENKVVILNNMNMLIDYTKKLQSTIQCYEDSYAVTINDKESTK